VRREHWLGPLQVRIGGQDNVEVGIATSDKGPLQIPERAIHMLNSVATPQSNVRGNLVVSAPTRVQLSPHIIELFDECRFDVHVDVFEFPPKRDLATFDLQLDGGQRLLDLATFIRGEDANMRQHLNMSDRAGDIALIQPVVEANTLAKGFDP
jgi:hypothetical protein